MHVASNWCAQRLSELCIDTLLINWHYLKKFIRSSFFSLSSAIFLPISQLTIILSYTFSVFYLIFIELAFLRHWNQHFSVLSFFSRQNCFAATRLFIKTAKNTEYIITTSRKVTRAELMLWRCISCVEWCEKNHFSLILLGSL